MNGWIYYFYAFILGASLLLAVLGVWLTAVMPGLDRWSKRFFRDYFVVLTVCVVSVLMEAVITFHPAPNAVVILVLYLECFFLSLPLPMLTICLLHCCAERFRESWLLRAALGAWAAYVVLLLLAPFIDAFTCSAPDGLYYRGSLYPLVLLPLVAIMLLNLAGVLRRRKRLSRKVFLSFLIAILPMTVALLAQMFADVFPLLDISVVLCSLSMFSLILSDQIERDLRRQREIANQRASIMVLQMRPHFIDNTLMSIYSLCNQDPQKARQVTMDFTNYLRKNFNAVAAENPVPFSAELEHTRAYLAVEQAQYEDALFVEYDTPHTMFRVPPLTLQPIVENSVKHGRDPYAGAFRISVRTRKTDSGSEIVVEDDGRGFAPTADGEGHLALDNIRQRLEIMCGGTLTIMPRDGGGTRVTVTVPDSARKTNALRQDDAI